MTLGNNTANALKTAGDEELRPARLFPLLTEEARLSRLGEIIASGIARYVHARGVAALADVTSQRPDARPRPEIWDLVTDATEKQILRYLQNHILCEPVQMRAALRVSSMTLTRRLARLRAAGLVRVSGRTRNARYELMPPENN